VPAAEKLVSLFEPHADIIRKGREVAYGRKLNLTTGRSGLILDVVIEAGNPADSERLLPMLERHIAFYGQAPRQAAADGSFASRDNLRQAKAAPSSPQKHVWRARIILLSADGVGTMAIARQAGVAKPTVWRWRERFLAEGIAGLVREKSRPLGIAPLPAEIVDQVVTLTGEPPPGEATHWTVRAMAKAVGVSRASVQRIWRAHGLQPHRWKTFKLSKDPAFATKLRDIVGLYVDPPTPNASSKASDAGIKR
jgi:hypothetical protein